MEAKDVPFFAALIFPGFFAIQTFIWSAGRLKLSDAMRVTWSFVLSVPIFFGAHAFFRLVEVWEPCLPSAAKNAVTCLPAPEVIASSTADAPVWFLVSLYAGGAILGYFTGFIWRKRWLEGALLVFGIDVRRHRPALNQALGQEAYIDLQLVDGPLYRGYPLLFSEEDEDVYIIYLTDALRREANSWKKLTRPLIIPFNRVERIQVLEPRRPLFREAPSQGAFARALSSLQRAFAALRV